MDLQEKFDNCEAEKNALDNLLAISVKNHFEAKKEAFINQTSFLKEYEKLKMERDSLEKQLNDLKNL